MVSVVAPTRIPTAPRGGGRGPPAAPFQPSRKDGVGCPQSSTLPRRAGASCSGTTAVEGVRPRMDGATVHFPAEQPGQREGEGRRAAPRREKEGIPGGHAPGLPLPAGRLLEGRGAGPLQPEGEFGFRHDGEPASLHLQTPDPRAPGEARDLHLRHGTTRKAGEPPRNTPALGEVPPYSVAQKHHEGGVSGHRPVRPPSASTSRRTASRSARVSTLGPRWAAAVTPTFMV